MADGQQQKEKVRGVADIVFLIDASGSMAPCIDALKQNIGHFIDSLTTTNQGNQSPVRDWRGKAMGYRDFEEDSTPLVDNPFVRDPAALKEQLVGLQPEGGGDEPESLLDALFTVATMGQTEKDQPEDDRRWRYRSSAARIVIVFTDASYKEKMVIQGATGGTFEDVKNKCHEHRIILSIFAPDLPCYDTLSTIQKSEYEPIPGPNFQEGMKTLTSDQNNFQNTLAQLAKSVSKSSEVVAL
jgi:hypothetical protein